MVDKFNANLLFIIEEEEEEEEEIELLLYHALEKEHAKVKRRWWVHPVTDNRAAYGTYHRLVKELELDDDMFQQYFRLSREQFQYVLKKVEELMFKRNARMRKAITPRERLAVTLRYLATGESFQSLAFSYRLGKSTIGHIVKEVCQVIWNTMRDEFMPMPKTARDWKSIADNFEQTWQFPNCCGAIDGKHIVMTAPHNSGSLYYNYKGTFSVVLLAVVDAHYKFITIDVGSYGMNNDSGIFRASRFGQALRNGRLPLPPDRPLPGAEEHGSVPYVFVADEGLPLLKHLMRPYGGRGKAEQERFFNYRLSRARRIVESTFGILSERWRVFHTKIAVLPDTTKHIAKAACVLHNFLQSTSTPTELNAVTTATYDDCDGLTEFRKNTGRSSKEAESVRSTYKDYFNNQGTVSWQTDVVRRGLFTE
ncbi:uncharacterized protein [Haliotis asinina]|uniref:uncharacterized protein n=1 Tax=Haliotis asinina TaxID=109174 RepID=UPI003531B551